MKMGRVASGICVGFGASVRGMVSGVSQGTVNFSNTGIFPTVADRFSLKLQVRVWDYTKAATFDEAVAAGGALGFFGQSCPFDYVVPLATDALGAKMDNFRGLPDFRCVPEPSALVTGGLGIAMLLLFRAKRRDKHPPGC